MWNVKKFLTYWSGLLLIILQLFVTSPSAKAELTPEEEHNIYSEYLADLYLKASEEALLCSSRIGFEIEANTLPTNTLKAERIKNGATQCLNEFTKVYKMRSKLSSMVREDIQLAINSAIDTIIYTIDVASAKFKKEGMTQSLFDLSKFLTTKGVSLASKCKDKICDEVKLNGYGVGIAVAVSVLHESVEPFVIGAFLSPAVVFVTAFIPFSLTYPFSAKKAQSLFSRLKNYYLYGSSKEISHESLNPISRFLLGRQRVIEIDQKNDALIRSIRFNPSTQTLFPISWEDGMVKALKIQKPTLKEKLLRYTQTLGWTANHLELNGLISYLKQEGKYEPYVAKVEKSKTLPAELKVVLIIKYLKSTWSTDALTKLETYFSHSFVKLKYDASKITPLLKWSKSLVIAETSREVRDLFLKFPNEATPRQIINLWGNVIIPQLIKNNTYLYTKDFRKLIKNLVVLKRDSNLMQSSDQPVNAEWRKKFQIYLEESLTPPTCEIIFSWR